MTYELTIQITADDEAAAEQIVKDKLSGCNAEITDGPFEVPDEDEDPGEEPDE